MGFYFRVAPGVKIRATKRGLRTSVGPRAARVHFGAGGTGVSTGAGPFTYYAPVRGGKRRPSTSRSTRALTTANQRRPSGPTPAQQQKAAQAQEIIAAISEILDLHRATFPDATAPAAVPPQVPTFEEVLARHTQQATAGIGRFHRRERADATTRATAAARTEFAGIQAEAKQRYADEQRRLEEWWKQLQANEPHHVMWAIQHAFEDNEAAAAPTGVQGSTASLVVHVPGTDVLPDRMPGTTAAGNLSLRQTTKSQRADLYKMMICGYALVTVKEAFAVAPGINEVAIVAVRRGAVDAYGARHPEVMAALRFERRALVGIQWQTADAVQIVNDAAKERVLEQRGAAGELIPLDLDAHPDIKAVLGAIDLEETPEGT